jgi:hypothetical protein
MLSCISGLIQGDQEIESDVRMKIEVSLREC